MTYGVFIAESQVLLSVALRHLDRIVNVVNGHSIVGDVLHDSRPSSTLQVGRECRCDARPYFDSSTVLDVISTIYLVQKRNGVSPKR